MFIGRRQVNITMRREILLILKRRKSEVTCLQITYGRNTVRNTPSMSLLVLGETRDVVGFGLKPLPGPPQ